MNKDPIRTQNAKKVLIKDQVLKIRTLLEAVDYVPYILSYFDPIPQNPDLPTSGPQIYGLNPSYRLGETLNLTCESGAGKY